MQCPTCRQVQPPIEGARFCALCGAMLPRYSDVADPLVGKIIGGRYRITKLIGAGGMGRVYAGEQQMGATTRRVALKILLSDFTVNTEIVSRFMRECSTVSELEHPNTIKFYDYGQTTEGDLYIAMEYVPGQSLADALKREGPIAPERMDFIASQICGSLQEAHERGFVHRDVKPDNILLATQGGEQDFVKVLDFGIAKRSGPNVPMITQEGQVVGSPPYMSPEQFSQLVVDARSDIYQLGVVTYEALTGKLPFMADTALAWAHQHMSEPPLPFETTPAGAAIPPNMKRAVLHALEKRPQDRPQSAREFYAELTIGHGRSSLVRASARPSAWSGAPEGRASGTVAMRPSRAAPTRVDDAPPAMSDASPSGPVAPPVAGSAPPPAINAPPPTVREPLPPTMRDPSLAPAPRGRRSLAIVLLLAALVAGGAVAAVLGIGRTRRGSEAAPTAPSPSPSASAPPAASTTIASAQAPHADEPPHVDVPPAASTAAATDPAAPNPCHDSIKAAKAGNCALALTLRRHCPDTHPDHAAAHAAFDRFCGGTSSAP